MASSNNRGVMAIVLEISNQQAAICSRLWENSVTFPAHGIGAITVHQYVLRTNLALGAASEAITERHQGSIDYYVWL